MRKKSAFLALLLPGVSALALLGALGGCASAVNRAAFYPDRVTTVRDDNLPPATQRVTIPTDDGEKLEGFFLRREGAEKLVIYFHGNGGNIAQRVPELARIASCGANVLGVGYRGYGASTGSPSEQGIYRDGRAALDYAVRTLGFSSKQIVLFGRSLGTTVAIDVATDQRATREFAGVVLVTPLTSGADVAKAHGASALAFLAGGAFPSEEKAARIAAPVLVIHGTGDEVIPFAQGRRIFERLTAPKRFIAIEQGRHNDLEQRDPATYWGAIEAFIATPPGA
jgi:pimeloyl-ACP methyl ester carboxylesterase